MSTHPTERQGSGVDPRPVHEYDGIIEEDNDLPRWWLGTLFGTMLFAFLYWAGYQQLNALRTPGETYQRELAEIAAVEAQKAKAAGPVSASSLGAITKDPASLLQGSETFTKICASCHGPAGGGLIGPNLTDDYWLHGGGPADIYRLIRDGYPAKGMPAWGPQIGEEKVRTAAAFVLSLRHKQVAGGKAPQGELVSD